METTTMARSRKAPANRHRQCDRSVPWHGIAEFAARDGDGTSPTRIARARRGGAARSSDNDGLSKPRKPVTAVSTMPKSFTMRPRRGLPGDGTTASHFTAPGTRSKNGIAGAGAVVSARATVVLARRRCALYSGPADEVGVTASSTSIRGRVQVRTARPSDSKQELSTGSLDHQPRRTALSSGPSHAGILRRAFCLHVNGPGGALRGEDRGRFAPGFSRAIRRGNCLSIDLQFAGKRLDETLGGARIHRRGSRERRRARDEDCDRAGLLTYHRGVVIAETHGRPVFGNRVARRIITPRRYFLRQRLTIALNRITCRQRGAFRKKCDGELFQLRGLRSFERGHARRNVLLAPPLQNRARELSINLGVNPLVQDFLKFLTQIRRKVQARQLHRFKRHLRTGRQVFERRTGSAHENASGDVDLQEQEKRKVRRRITQRLLSAMVPE